MNLIDQNGSPFVILWYFYLGFFAVVLIANLVFLVVGRLIGWRSRRLLRHYYEKKPQAGKGAIK
ncbi:MAG TPA: hypothetical protein VLG11_04745 [Candidatus Saccharimonadales bacterium]|nr:hypothetical protein [Candidatus Saccharimonadales bacterium]